MTVGESEGRGADAWLRIRRLAVKELRQLLRDPKTKRIIFAAPVIQLLLFGYAVNTDVREIATAVVDHDRTRASRELVDAFTAGGLFRVVERSDDPRAIVRALDRGRAVAGVQIPPGFGRDLAAGRSPAVQILVDGTNSNTATVAQGYATRIVLAFGARAMGPAGTGLSGGEGVGGDGRSRARAAAEGAGGVELRARAWFNPGLQSRVYNVPAVIGVIVLLMCLLLTALAVVRERELGTLDQLLVSPLSAGELMLGKTLPVAGIALFQLAVITAVALLWFEIPFRGLAAALLGAAVLYILAGLSFGLLISTLSRTQQEAFLAIFLFFFPAIILSGFLYPIETMPVVFQRLTLVNPLRHFLEIVRGIFLKGSGVDDLWIQYAVLLVTALLVMRLAVVRFRRSVG